MMRAESDDVHCDSLAGAELGAAALSVAPSLRPARPTRRWLHAAWTGALFASAVALILRWQSEPEVERADALKVQGRTLTFSAGFAARAGIHTIEVRESAFSPVVNAVGKTMLDPNGVASVDANALGLVRRVARYEGDTVKAGDELAEIGSAGLARLQAESFARARAAGADDTHQLGVSVVRSPIDGTVIERRVVTGQAVKGERVLFVVADLDRLELALELDPHELHAVALGDRVELSRDASGVVEAGKVLEVGSTRGPGPQLVRVGVDNHARHLRPGEAVSARIFASGGVHALVIPNRALAWIAGHPAVFVESGHNSVNASQVTLGGVNGDQTEVSVGLAPGQRIVSDGVGVLKDESFL